MILINELNTGNNRNSKEIHDDMYLIGSSTRKIYVGVHPPINKIKTKIICLSKWTSRPWWWWWGVGLMAADTDVLKAWIRRVDEYTEENIIKFKATLIIEGNSTTIIKP
jgi:hypothetical protein